MNKVEGDRILFSKLILANIQKKNVTIQSVEMCFVRNSEKSRNSGISGELQQIFEKTNLFRLVSLLIHLNLQSEGM